MTPSSYTPNIAIHPGRTLLGMLTALNMSQAELSDRTGLTVKTINEIVQEKNPITSDTAIKFSSVFSVPVSFWENLQKNYEATLTRLKEQEMLEHETKQLKRFNCYKEIMNLGLVPNTRNPVERVKALLNFFSVGSLDRIETVHEVAYRTAGRSKQSPEAVAAWLRCGEILAKKIEAPEFDRNKLVDSIETLREYTRKSPEEFQKSGVDLCASFGVIVVVLPHFKDTGVSAAVRWLDSDKVLVQLSLRWKHDDIFWFNFFHELGHVLKHGKKDQFIEFEKHSSDEKEEEANAFAQNTLIPPTAFIKFKHAGNYSKDTITNFANEIGVSVSVVAGRLARETKDYKSFAHLRNTRYEFVKE